MIKQIALLGLNKIIKKLFVLSERIFNWILLWFYILEFELLALITFLVFWLEFISLEFWLILLSREFILFNLGTISSLLLFWNISIEIGSSAKYSLLNGNLQIPHSNLGSC